MNTEQLRAEFEAWARNKNYDLDAVMLLSKPPKFSRYANPATQDAWEAFQAGRAALQSQDQIPAPTNRDEYIALLDRAIDMGKRLNVLWEEAFAEVGVKHGLQSQDAEDSERYRWLLGKFQQSYDGEDFEAYSISIRSHMVYQSKGERAVQVEISWWDKTDEPIGISEAIDHARRVEGKL